MTHQELVVVAAQWLRKTNAIVVTEVATSGEEPDAVGWHNGRSTLVECKATRSDFIADSKKFFRRDPDQGIGNFRYFLSNPGVISLDDLPPNWGLLIADKGKVRSLRKAELVKKLNHRQETRILTSLIRRIGKDVPINVSVKVYTIGTKNRSTLGIEPPSDQ